MKQIQTKKGFTLMETLIAIFILLISITAPLSSAQSGLRSSFLARDQIGAFYLAQDSVEVIKNLRDNYVLANPNTNNWLDGLRGTAGNNGCMSNSTTARKCTIDTSGNSVVLSSCSGTCGQLYYNSNNRKYTHTSGGANTSLSKYTRVIYVTELVNEKEAQVIVDITWDSSIFASKRLVVQENIYNWVKTYAQ